MSILVTGCTGFVGSHVVKSLLEAGQAVRGTVRSKANTAKYQFLLDLSSAGGKFEVCELDLVTSNEADWDAALAGCVCVVHVAAGTTFDSKNPKKDLLEPTVRGTERLLAACERAGVKRLVLTSSISAVSQTFRNKPVFSNEDWNHVASLTNQPYAYCKVTAEELCIKFCKEHGIALCVIIPGVIFGAPINQEPNSVLTSGALDTLNGKIPIVLNLVSPLCDVLDVAKLHRIAALDHTICGRFLCCSASISQAKSYDLLFAALPSEYAKRKPKKTAIPDFVMRLIVRLTQPKALSDLMTAYLGGKPEFDTKATLDAFNLEGFVPAEDTLRRTALWALESKLITPP